MLYWLLWAGLFLVIAADPVVDFAVDPAVDPAKDLADPVVPAETVYHDDRYEDHPLYNHGKHHQGNEHENRHLRNHHQKDHHESHRLSHGYDRNYDDQQEHIAQHGPNRARVLNPHQVAFDPHNKHHIRIIENVYSPDYYEPSWILDYRYLKTGGRQYTRSDGGQVLILPKGIESDAPTKFHTYDELLEFLRLKELARANKKHSHEHENEHKDREGLRQKGNEHGHKDHGYGYRYDGYGHDDYNDHKGYGHNYGSI